MRCALIERLTAVTGGFEISDDRFSSLSISYSVLDRIFE